MINKKLIFIHVAVICVLIGAIFGISFAIINPDVSNINKYKITTCFQMNYTINVYSYCYQLCNTTIPNCTALLNQNISGRCYNSSENYDLYKTCYVVCDPYNLIYVVYSYGPNSEFLQTINVDCRNNNTCLNNVINSTNITCYYDITNPLNIRLVPPPLYQWEFIVVIIVLCLLLIGYAVINLTVFKKHLFIKL